jgi:molybdopterin synthase catalytic subunit
MDSAKPMASRERVFDATQIRERRDKKVLANLKNKNSGSLVFHVGTVRPFSEGKQVASIEYRILRNRAEEELGHIVSQIRERWEINDIALCRRTGRLNFGDVILIAAVSTARHKPAFEACQFAVEQMKIMKSVNKNEIFQEMLEKQILPSRDASLFFGV